MTVTVSEPQRRLDEASAADLDRVRRVASVAELEAVTLTRLACVRGADAEAHSRVDFDSRANVEHVLSSDKLLVRLSFVFSTEPDVFRVDAEYVAAYGLKQTVSDQDAEAFVRLNSVFNVWPYWRELVQNAATRMGFAAPVIPLLKV